MVKIFINKKKKLCICFFFYTFAVFFDKMIKKYSKIIPKN